MNSLAMGIGGIIHSLITVYIWVVIISALLTWVKPDPYNPIVQTLYRLTEPAYAALRRYIPTNFNGIDLAPLILVVGLNIIDIVLMSLFYSI
ncbi:MAG: YggT family protein [Campylobacterota bacterium]|nr:YggT family protein [Campylobacterota bacterium]